MYNNLMAQERYEARVFCRRRLNADRFPFPADAIRSTADGRDGPAARAEEVLYAALRRSPRLDRSIEAFEPDLFHAHFGVDGVYALRFAERMKRPLAVSVHGYDVSRLPRFQLFPVSWFNYWLYFDRLVEHTDRFVAHTRFTAAQLEAKGVPRERISVHYLGIPLERYAVERSNERRPRNVLFVGRFVEKKGIESLLRAFAVVAGRLPDTRLILVGSGPQREEIERRISELGLADRVDLPGFVPQERLRDWFERAAVFCHPSRTSATGEAEGIVISNLEAQAAGLPVVATRHGGIPEGIEDGETGILVQEGDVQDLARALGALLDDESARARMSRAAVTRIRERFDVRKQAARLEVLYDEILST
jgi:glycosyltransferase involved in cell wall biosynthesis